MYVWRFDGAPDGQLIGYWGHFWGEVPDISHKNKHAREAVVFLIYVWPFWGSDGWEW